MSLDNILYVLDMTKSLLSTKQIAKKGFLVMFDNKQCDIKWKCDLLVVTVGSLDLSNNLYQLYLKLVKQHEVNLLIDSI